MISGTLTGVALLSAQGCSVYDPGVEAGETGSMTSTQSVASGSMSTGSSSGLTTQSNTGAASESTSSQEAGEPGPSTATGSSPTSSSSSTTLTSSESSSTSSSSSSSAQTSSSSTDSGKGGSSGGGKVGPCPLRLITDKLLRQAVSERLGAGTTDFAALEQLDVSPPTVSGKIKSLAGLECAKKLRSIALEEQDIKDLTPLKDLDALTKIKLQYNPVSSPALLSAVGDRLEEIQELSLSLPSSSEDLEWVEKLSNANYVSFFGPGIDTELLRTAMSLAKVEKLHLAGIGVFEDGALEQLCGPGHAAKYPKSRCSQLTHLTLHTAKLQDLKWIPETNRLVWMDLRQNLIEDLGPLRRAKNLTRVFLSRNSIVSIEALGDLKALEFLQIFENRELKDLSPLSKLTKLRYIQAAGCSISDLSTIQGIKSLGELDFQRNQIVSLEPLRNLENLFVVRLGENQIRSIEGLGQLKKLEGLSVNDNPGLTAIDAVSGMDKLREFRAQKAQITDVTGVVARVRKGQLRLVHLEGNPKALCEHSSMKELLALRKDPVIGKDLKVVSDCE